MLRNDLAVFAESLSDLGRAVLQVDAVLDLLDGERIALLDGGSNDSAGQGKSRGEVGEGRHVR